MGCTSCSQRNAGTAVQYPRTITLPDGSTASVTSSADERVQRERYRQREREKARTTGYTVAR